MRFRAAEEGLSSVADEVDEGAPELLFVDIDERDVGLEVHGDRNAVPLEFIALEVNDSVDELVEVAEGGRGVREASKAEVVFGERGEPLNFTDDVAECVERFAVSRDPMFLEFIIKEFSVEPYGGERIAELMSDFCGELADSGEAFTFDESFFGADALSDVITDDKCAFREFAEAATKREQREVKTF